MKFTSSYEPGEFESKIYGMWEASGAFKPVMPTVATDDDGNGTDDRTEGGDDPRTFSIVMPPPNANGNLHIGHGLTVAIEDALTRYYRLQGRASWYVPGADHAGFETWVVYERFLEKQGKTRFEFSRDELYARVWDFVAEQRGNMELQLRALGASCSWDDLTFTLDENVVDRVYTTFEKMWKDGLIYRGEKLVSYCPKHQTAFADIEVEHEDEDGTLWDVAYKVVGEDGEIVVSTTRPETLFGDTAVAVNPNDERYAGLKGKFVKVPICDRAIPIVFDEHADMEYGTGAVKITPAHDFDDFEVGERHNLPRISVIDGAGRMVGCGAEYDGLSALECRKKVLEELKAQELLRGEKKIKHAVAHCYKCGAVIEPMLKEQWFIDVKKLAQGAIERLEKDEIKFYPEGKKQVLINYLRGLKDWNISRQIPWGIAIPMFKKADDTATGAPEWIFDRRTNLQMIEVGGVKYIRDEDTFDTWFSSSHWPMVCTDWTESADGKSVANPFYPLNVMETAGDILFAWVARMIMMGVYVTGEVPFREVYLHGLVLDEHGKKMSKSKGNVINPMEMVLKYGSDAFRLGILRGRSAGMNQAFSEQSVVAGRNLCNKLWNVSRYIQGVVENQAAFDETSDGEIAEDATYNSVVKFTTDNMGEDWICREISQGIKAVEKCMKEYRFAEAVEVLYSLIWDKYADWFIESQKIYQNIPLLKKTLEVLLIALHPFAPFVTEAIWNNLSWTNGMVIEQKWPCGLKFDPISAQDFENLMAVAKEARGTMQTIQEASNKALNGQKPGLLYDNDSLVKDNAELLKFLTKVPEVVDCENNPRGIRLALMNREVYVDVPDEVVSVYKKGLEDKILAVGRELDMLNARLMNPNYVDKAPAELVKETRNGVDEKTALLKRLREELIAVAESVEY